MTKAIAIEEIELTDDRVAFVEAKPGGWAGSIEVEAFRKALKDAGVPEEIWPNAPTANKCLQRAMDDQKHDRRTLVRPLPKGKGWSLVLEDGEELNLEEQGAFATKQAHTVTLTCRVKKVNDTEYVEATPWDHPNARSVKESFAQWQDNFKASQDLSIWFSQTVVPWCNGVSTRSRGGSYYIVKGEPLNRMLKITKALESVSYCYNTPINVGETTVNRTIVEQGGRIILKPEVASTAAVEILLDNFIAECDKVCDEVNSKLEDSNLGHRAISTQRDIASEQAKKLKLFETLLDTKLDDLSDRLEETESSAGLLALKALEKD